MSVANCKSPNKWSHISWQKNGQNIINFTFFQFWDRTSRDCDSKDVPASNYDRKIAARPFDTIHDILQRLIHAESALKVEK